MKILIVDDHAGMREMLSSLFASPDDHVEVCSRGDEAVEAYRRFEPDWVLMDVMLAGDDGVMATRRIVGEFPAARVLVVTNHGDAGVFEAARAAGARGFLLKDDLLKVPELIGRSERGLDLWQSGEVKRSDATVGVARRFMQVLRSLCTGWIRTTNQT